MANLFIKLYKIGALYQTPINLSYWWNFGSLAAYALLIQLTSGFFLSLWYIPSVDLAFDSVEYIMREVNYGWLVRYFHSNGASFFFFVVYLHMSKGLYYGSYTYPRERVWYSGFIIFLLMVATAFFGYVLPWGQMSYWAATVITSLLSSIPIIGSDLLIFVWGNNSVGQATLSRIYSFHFILPFIILGLVILHLFLLHEHGSNNPLGVQSCDNIPFHPYYTRKDILGIMVANIFLFFFVFFIPNFLSHPDNYIPANPNITPLHIVPEWYFLPFYGILRSVPNKIGGILLLISALLCLAFFPIISQPIIRSGSFRPLFQPLFWFFICDCILLGWSGGNPVSYPYYEICQFATVLFFLFFLLNFFLIKLERYILCGTVFRSYMTMEEYKIKNEIF